MTVFQVVGHDEVGTMTQQHLCLTIVVHRRRCVRVLILCFRIARPINFPDLLAGRRIQRNDNGFASLWIAFTVNQLNVEHSVVEHRSGTHSELNAEVAVSILKIELPDFFSFDGVTGHRPFTHERPDMLAVGHW